MLVGALGRPTIGYSRPRGEAQLPPPLYRTARLVEAKLPLIGEETKLPPPYPGMVTLGPGRRPNSLLHTGACSTCMLNGRFALPNKNPGVHEDAGLLKVQWSTYCCYHSCVEICGLNSNMRQSIN